MGVVQKRPILTPGVAKLADSAATTRSQAATSWQPAAVARPCTRAITGCVEPAETEHHARTELEQRPVLLLRLPDHLGEVMA